jgi:hypothetical protein
LATQRNPQPQYILFFSDSLDHPRLVGFDNSRPDHPTEISVRSKPDTILDRYRHPEYYKNNTARWQRKFDVFAIGVVLMEIAFWNTAEKLHQRWQKHTETDTQTLTGFWNALRKEFVDMLGPTAGSAYREAARACLVGIESVREDDLREWFGEEVVGRLEGCRA